MKNKECTCCEKWKMFFTKSNAAIKAVSLLCLIFAAFLFSAQTVHGQTSIKGVAPVVYPPGGFAVDGNAISNYLPASIYDSAGDWFSDPAYPGPGGTVFNMSTPDPFDLNYPMAKHWNDGWMQGTDLTIFTQRTKINDDPKTMTGGPDQSRIKTRSIMLRFSFPGETRCFRVEIPKICGVLLRLTVW